MRKPIVATVCLLLLSVAALPVQADGTGADESVDRAGSQPVVAAGSATVASAGDDAAPSARRAASLALPGVDPVDVPLLVAVGGLLVLLLGASVLLLGRGRSSADHPSSDAGGGQVDGNGIPATSTPTADGNPEGRSPAVRTDEEYVVQLLIANHGRMRQARIVEETDWSKAKVSRLLSRMEEQEQVVRERAGREKIVQLADANTSIPL